MTELELICSPFDTVEVIVRGCFTEPISEEMNFKVKSVTARGKEAFKTTLKLLDESKPGDSRLLIYDFILPALHSILSNDLHYRTLSVLLPSEVVRRLQRQLPRFSSQSPSIDWWKIIKEFLLFHDFAITQAKVRTIDLGFVDSYISIAFTKIIQHLVYTNMPYDEKAIDKEFDWVLERIHADKHMLMHLTDDALIKSGDLEKAKGIRQRIENIVHALTYYEASPLIPAWIRKQSVDEAIRTGEKTIKRFKAVEARIKENTEELPIVDSSANKWLQQIDLDIDFSNLFSTVYDAKVCLALLQRYNLIKTDGTHNIGVRDKNKLMALVAALHKRLLLPKARRTPELTIIIAKQIGLTYNRPRENSQNDYDEHLRDYISKLNAISMEELTWTKIGSKWMINGF